MDARAVRAGSASDAEPPADVLVSGGDGPGRPGRGPVLAAAALALAGAVAVVVPAGLDGDEHQDEVADLALVDGAVPVPRRDAAPVQGRVEGGVHLAVVNDGAQPVRLLSAVLRPGRWQVAVVDDLDGDADPVGAGRLLRPGWSAVLVLHRSFRCAPGADHGRAPTSLSVHVEVAGRERTRSLDVEPAYGGALAALLDSPDTFCDPHGGTASSGTAGDPALPFLRLWPAGRGVLPFP